MARLTVDRIVSVLVAYRWNGKAWQWVSMPHPTISGDPGIATSSSRTVWLSSWLDKPDKYGVEPGFVQNWNGHRWRDVTAPRSLATGTYLVTDGRGGVWLGPWARWTGRAWVNTLPGPRFAGSGVSVSIAGLARIPGSTTVWGVGNTSPKLGTWYSLIAAYGPLPR